MRAEPPDDGLQGDDAAEPPDDGLQDDDAAYRGRASIEVSKVKPVAGSTATAFPASCP
jgi:hypothetical protein